MREQLNPIGMRSIEYRRWSPSASPLSVEFPAAALAPLGRAESSGVLYGSRQGRQVRVTALSVRQDEEQEKVGVFVSRIRGEVFLTEADLIFMNRQHADLALVVVGSRAGFFVREANGSIQTVRSLEEFSVIGEAQPATPPPAAKPRPAERKPIARRPTTRRPVGGKTRWVPAGAVALAGLPLMALAMFPQRSVHPQESIDVWEAQHQLRISWTPAQNAVLSITDGGATMSIPVGVDQSSVVYVPRSEEVEVKLTGLRSMSTRYKSLAGRQ